MYCTNNVIIFLAILLSLASCFQKQAPLFTHVDAAYSGVTFSNDITEDDTFNIVDFYYVYNGGGVAIGDLNNDKLPDLYFTGNRVGDRLYLNKGNLKFEDITDQAGIIKRGWSTGVTMADVNADGLLDIYVCKSGNYASAKRANQLYINNGDLTFREEAQQWNLADTSYTNQAAFFDYDKDGDLDAFLITSTNAIRNPNKLTPLKENGTGLSVDKLFQNQGNYFTDVSLAAGILNNGFGLGLAIHDLNDDGWEDILVSNDFLANDHLYVNNKNGTFTESSKQYFKHHSHFSMGNDVSDFNNDGLPDVIVVDMLPADHAQRKKMAGPVNPNTFEAMVRAGYHPQYMRNMLQLNLGKNDQQIPVFAEIGQQVGVHSTDWSWAPLFADFDHDGWRDLMITNGYLRDITDMDFIIHNNKTASTADGNKTNETIEQGAIKMPSIRKNNCMFKNTGDGNFNNVTGDWLGDHPSLSNGASIADLDQDGDLDIVVNNINEPAFILKNNVKDTRYIAINLIGPPQNTKGLGSKVTVYCEGRMQTQHMSVTRGYQSSVDYTLNFGLGACMDIDSLEVIWPDGKREVRRKIKPNQAIVFDYAHGNMEPQKTQQLVQPWLKNVTQQHGLDHRHQEPFYMDYDVEPLLPHKLSQQGPCLAIADVNGDGREDFFIGGSYQHSGSIFIQDEKGNFQKKSIIQLPEKYEEDTGAVFLDAGNDGDQDLYVVSGSNEFHPGSPYYQDRLYVNDGRGSFTTATDRLPTIRHSGSCAVPQDYDKDGDVDLFIGGRLTPLEFPKPGTSYLLRNDGGKFTDATDRVAPALQSIGMVTDAVWVDIDGDDWLDLALVGEYMPVTIFKNHQGILKKLDIPSLQHTHGLWNCIVATDVDGDGDSDLIAGNVGLNSRYRLTKERPLSIYGGDFDNNNRWDAIPAYHFGDTEYPVPALFDLVRQLPRLKSKYQTFDAYSKVTMDAMITLLAKPVEYVARAYEQRSMIIENQGNNQFVLNPLPDVAQRSPIRDIAVADINRDGYNDLVLVGNDYATEVVEGQHDAGVGSILTGNGKGLFQAVPPRQTGFWAEGDARQAGIINMNNTIVIIVTRNNNSILAFKR